MGWLFTPEVSKKCKQFVVAHWGKDGMAQVMDRPVSWVRHEANPHLKQLRRKRKDIPLIARIISVADTYDAMTSDRAYRRALPHEVTVSEIVRCSGTQFDPDIAGTFTERIELLREELRATGHETPE